MREAAWPSGAGRIAALQAYQSSVLGQYLGIVIGGVYCAGDTLAGWRSGLLHFMVLPVGRGNHIEIQVTCAEPALRTCLDGLIVEITRLWVRDRDDLDPDKRHILRSMHLSPDLAGFTAGLREWQGRSCPEIGRTVHQSAKTVLSRPCALQKSYGGDAAGGRYRLPIPGQTKSPRQRGLFRCGP